MLKKTHALALTVATAGLLGFAAPMASAATMSLGGNPHSVVNVSNNQVPVEACGNDAYGNIIGGQVPGEGDPARESLLSPSAVPKDKAVNKPSWKMKKKWTIKHG